MKIPMAVRPRAGEIIAHSDAICDENLDGEYGRLCRVLIGRLARKRPSPLQRGDTRIWAAGCIYAIGQLNFLFDRTQTPHLTADQLAERIGVVKTTMANKAAMINKTLGLGIYEPELTREAILMQHPMTWIIDLNGFLLDAR
ncbi:MAG: DUF6398 domain-containing protein, partial [Solirubrobacteraceae bacterium]